MQIIILLIKNIGKNE